MDAARPLRDVFADLAQDEDAHSALDVLRASGHPDLPDGLVAEAVGTYADTAPIEVAEHLSPYVMAHSPVPLPDLPEVDAGGWLDAMVTAPVMDDTMPIDAMPFDAMPIDGEPIDGDLPDHGLLDHGILDHDVPFDATSGHHLGAASDSGTGLDFGHGTSGYDAAEHGHIEASDIGTDGGHLAQEHLDAGHVGSDHVGSDHVDFDHAHFDHAAFDHAAFDHVGSDHADFDHVGFDHVDGGHFDGGHLDPAGLDEPNDADPAGDDHLL